MLGAILIFKIDSQLKDDGGIIPSIEMNGVNPVEYLEYYLSRLRSDNIYFFQHPMRESKKFNIHNCDTKVYFEC